MKSIDDLHEIILTIMRAPKEIKLMLVILSILMLLSGFFSGMDPDTVTGIKTLIVLSIVLWVIQNPPDIILHLSK